MTEAYFVGRSELLSWINCTLDLRLSKVEETANGAVACQLLDALFPNTVPMKKVDFNAKNEYDMINNYKVMQDVFNRLGVDKHVDVSKLIKGRPLDNIEFLQWLKAYWDGQTSGQPVEDYDPVSRRQLCKTGNIKSGGAGPAAPRAAAGSAGALQRRAAAPVYASKGSATPPPGGVGGGGGGVAAGRSKRSLVSTSSSSDDMIERLQDEVHTWRCSVEAVTKEKDFYYSKLRAIELLCNTAGISSLSGTRVAKMVEEILYAATQDDGEACLAAAIAELELKEDAAAAAAAAAAGALQDAHAEQQAADDAAAAAGLAPHGSDDSGEGHPAAAGGDIAGEPY